MSDKEEPKERKRMIVEEVETQESPKVEEEKQSVPPVPQISEEAVKTSSSISEESEEKENQEVIKEPEPIPAKKSLPVVLWIIIPGAFLLGAILGGIIFYQKSLTKNRESLVSPSPATTSTPEPSSTPTASIDLTKYTITIFNGSGIAGEANRVKTLLNNAGFKVGSTANATSYDFTKTVVKAKSDVETMFLNQLTSTLSKNYTLDTNQTLATSSADEVQVTVGSTKAQ